MPPLKNNQTRNNNQENAETPTIETMNNELPDFIDNLADAGIKYITKKLSSVKITKSGDWVVFKFGKTEKIMPKEMGLGLINQFMYIVLSDGEVNSSELRAFNKDIQIDGNIGVKFFETQGGYYRWDADEKGYEFTTTNSDDGEYDIDAVFQNDMEIVYVQKDWGK